MKAFLNPLLFVLCILLFAFGYVAEAEGSLVETWVLTLCMLGVILNGTLGVARALTGRPSVQTLGWAVGFLIVGSVVWALVSGERAVGVSSQERQLLQERVAAWQGGQLSPYAVDESGDCILTLAAGLGKEEIIADLLAEPGAVEAHAALFASAAHRAAERNRDQVLRQLVSAGVPVDARWEDMSLLHTATLSKARRAVACLLELGACVNASTTDGSTALHLAAIAEDAEVVRLLLQHGADPTLLNADGRNAASYARSAAVTEALEASAAAAP